MTEYILDPTRTDRRELRPEQAASLRTLVLREARHRSEQEGVELIVEQPRRRSDVAILWFEGERRAVLRAVGGWDPHPDLELHLAHARPRAARFELSLYVTVRNGELRV
jgi:hypothetical protein